MKGLTDSVPKPMLTVAGKTLLEHKFDMLLGRIDELVLIIGYQGDIIRKTYGDVYKGIPIRYVEQEELNGTMGALVLAKPFLHDRFVVMMGDDLYGAEDLANALAVGDWAMLVESTEHMASGGCVIIDNTGEVQDIEEGNHSGKPGLMNTNLFVLDARIFEYPLVPKAKGSEEYGLPQTVLVASKASGIPLHAVFADSWIQITSPEDIAGAEARLKTIE